ncbi:MAG: enoyl-ACP reductase [Chloroflexi bacterium]|nr:enoyl-ACP reductase [Chloroflexota bacterium]
MSLLNGKNVLIFGVANDHSIAWGIAKEMHNEGATIALSYAAEILERRVKPLAESIGVTFVEECDVTSDDQIDQLFAKMEKEFGTLDILVHAIAFANREDLLGRYLDTSREGFRLAMDVSVYSFTALARASRPLMKPGGSMVTMTYYGSQKVIPRYNVMGVAKAALEATVRYLAADLGPEGIRVNALSAGPIRTLAAAGIPKFKQLHREFMQVAPLREGITPKDIGDAAVWISSDKASKITGEVLFIDSGYNILGLTVPTDSL